jgi:uncharacterized protein YaiE (UPF0345 family)
MPPGGFFLLASGGRGLHVRAMEFANVTATAEANVYFDGKVVSHTIVLADGARKTLGVIFPGTYHFGTAAAEQMDITAGTCAVTLDGETSTNNYASGESFQVPANSGFTIVVADGLCQYVCSFLA